MLTVVWGAEFVDLFLRLPLRTLLSPGNLPDLAASHPVAYSLYCTQADAERLRASPVFRRAAALVDFQLHAFDPREIDLSDPYSHWILWRRGAAIARKNHECLVTVAGDHIFSRGTLMHWAGLFAVGRLAIFTPGIQVVLETIAAEIDGRFGADAAVDLPREELHALLFRHFHPVKISMFRDSPRWISHPEEHWRAVAPGCMLHKVLTSHAVAFHAGELEIDESFSPRGRLDRLAFEPCRFLSAEPLLKLLPSYYRRWRMDADTLNAFGAWGDFFYSDANLVEATKTHSYRIGPAAPFERMRAAESAARFFVAQMQASRQIHRLWRELRRIGAFSAASLLAAAHLHGRLRRRVALKPPFAVLIPAESALKTMRGAPLRGLLENDCAQLVRAIRRHIVRTVQPLREGDCLAMATSAKPVLHNLEGEGFQLARDRGLTTVVREPIQLDGVTAYLIDRPLGNWASEALPLVAQVRLHAAHAAARALMRQKDAERMARQVLSRHPRIHKLMRGLRNRLRPGKTRTAPEARNADFASQLLAQAFERRTRDALFELFALYEQGVLAGTGLESSPASQLRARDPRLADATESLRAASGLAPQRAEIWLELGYTLLERGDETGALDSFRRARDGVVHLPPGPLDTKTAAMIEISAILERRGQAQEAWQVLEAVPPAARRHRRFNLLAARLLLALGREDESLAAFERCMDGDSTLAVHPAWLPNRMSMLEKKG